MSAFSVDDFFDLSQFAHADLFNGCTHVWQALGKIKDYLASQSLGKIEANNQEFAFLVNPELISIGEGSVIEPGAYIKGPCIIGKNCHIRHGAYIRGDVIVGDNCVIGHTTEIKNSIMINHANAAHFAYVGDSILGSFVNLGAGVKCANLRLDGQEVIVERISTGMRKFGAIIGDHSQIGCNTVLNPGSVLGKRVHCFPCLNFGGVVEADRIIKTDVKPSVKNKT